MRVLSLGAILMVAAFAAAREPARDPLDVSTGAELEEALSGPRHNAVIRLAPGIYELTPEAAFDSTCGHCVEPGNALVLITVGLTISGRNLRIEGPADGTATIVTHAGYGLYFKDCVDCELERITITGGERGAVFEASDAAIVATRSSVAIRNSVVRDNDGYSGTISRIRGIAGICGREGAELTIERCEILCNSRNGIALYRDARALIANNLIEGGGASSSRTAIEVKGSAHAVIEQNLITRYGEGVGICRDADVVARGNIIEGVIWGIRAWDEHSGVPHFIIERNVVYDCAACGIAVMISAAYEKDDPAGQLTANFVVHTRQDPNLDSASFCYQMVPDGLSIRGNVYYDNREGVDDPFGQNTTKEMFWRERRGWVRTFRNTGVGVDGRVKFHESAFLTAYPRWWN